VAVDLIKVGEMIGNDLIRLGTDWVEYRFLSRVSFSRIWSLSRIDSQEFRENSYSTRAIVAKIAIHAFFSFIQSY
jgi:hypothetical protein